MEYEKDEAAIINGVTRSGHRRVANGKEMKFGGLRAEIDVGGLRPGDVSFAPLGMLRNFHRSAEANRAQGL